MSGLCPRDISGNNPSVGFAASVSAAIKNIACRLGHHSGSCLPCQRGEGLPLASQGGILPSFFSPTVRKTRWLGHRKNTALCFCSPRTAKQRVSAVLRKLSSPRFGTHNGCPLCYEMPRSSFSKGGKRARGKPEGATQKNN